MVMKKRELGLDALRIVSMFFIICGHILMHGGIIGGEAYGSAGYYFSSFLYLAVYCGVNCFALITGYVCCEKQFKLSGIIKIWASALFWSVIVSCVFFIADPGTFTIKEAISMFLPVIRGRYWFLNAYLVVFMFSPALNRLIAALDKRTYRLMLFAAFVLFGIIPVLSLGNDVMRISGGFEFSWLIVMYLTGGYVKKFTVAAVKKNRYILGFLAFAAVHIVFKALTEAVTERVFGTPSHGDLFLTYTSPLIAGESICLFMFFKNLTISRESIVGRVIRFTVPEIFSVYIIHVHPLIFWGVLPGLFAFTAEWNPVLTALFVAGASAAVFCVCVFLDRGRIFLFKIAHINEICDKIGDKLTKLAYRLSGAEGDIHC